MTANIVNSSLCNNTAVGGAGSANAPGADGIGGGLSLAFSAVTLTDTIVSHNQAIGGAGGGQGMGGGYAIGFGVLFGYEDTSSVTLNGGSVVSHNQPDNAFQF